MFDYHAVKTTQPTKLRFVSLKRQLLTVWKVRTAHTVFLKGRYEIHTGGNDGPTRLRNSLRAAFPFSIETTGPAAFTIHFGARSPIDLSYWLAAFRAADAMRKAGETDERECLVTASSPQLAAMVGANHIYAGWLLFFSPDGVWRYRYCIFNTKSLTFQLCKKIPLLNCSIARASFDNPNRRDTRIALVVSSGAIQKLNFLFDHSNVASIWTASLKLAQRNPFQDFSMLSFEDILASESGFGLSSGGIGSASSGFGGGIGIGIGIGSAVSGGGGGGIGSTTGSGSGGGGGKTPRNSSIVDQARALARRRSSNAPSTQALAASRLFGAVSDCDHTEFRALINTIIAENPRSLFLPVIRSTAGELAQAPGLFVLSLDGGILESGIRNCLLLQALEKRFQRVAEDADIIIASSESAFVACALASGFTLTCSLKLLELAISHTLESHTTSEGLKTPRYDPRYFEILCDEVFVGKTFASLQRHVVIPSVQLAAPHLKILHNVPDSVGILLPGTLDELVSSAILRSLSSPGIFPSFAGSVDPASCLPDPSGCIFSLFQKTTLERMRMLSLGSSQNSPRPWEMGSSPTDWGPLQWAPLQQDLSALLAQERTQSIVSSFLQDGYHRLSLLLPEPVPLLSLLSIRDALDSALSNQDLSSTFEFLSSKWKRDSK